MKKLTIALSALGFSAVSASAADMALKAPPPVAPVFDWNGFYVGANGGYGWNDRGTASGITYSSPVTGFAATSSDFRPNGGFGGAQFGYNWQRDVFLLGAEADIQGASIKDGFTVTVPSNGLPLNVVASDKIDYFGTVRARAGYVWDRTLFYGTLGFAYGGIRQSFNLLNGGATAALAGSSVGTGFVAGGGVEYHFNRAWSVKAEYQYIDLGSTNQSGTSSNGVPLITSNVQTKFQTVRVGVNYTWGGPIVAKY